MWTLPSVGRGWNFLFPSVMFPFGRTPITVTLLASLPLPPCPFPGRAGAPVTGELGLVSTVESSPLCFGNGLPAEGIYPSSSALPSGNFRIKSSVPVTEVDFFSSAEEEWVDLPLRCVTIRNSIQPSLYALMVFSINGSDRDDNS